VVALVGRRAEPLERLAAELRSNGGDAIAAPADVWSPEQAAAAVDAAVERFGGIDAVVYNAGVADSAAAAYVTGATVMVDGGTTVIDPTSA
jgi:3-oxoacyl-[acyl-carrier protein] reductase